MIPAYQASGTLARALISVIGQSHPAYEVIVVDDGSTDSTSQIAARFNTRVITQTRKGVSRARNSGIEAARGEWIAFLDADDVWLPYHLAGLDAAICTFATVSFVGSRGPRRKKQLKYGDKRGVNYFNSNLRTVRRARIKEVDFFRHARRHKFFRAVDMSSVAVEREAVRDAGIRFDESVDVGEDAAFFCDMAAISRLGWISTATTITTRTPGSVMTSIHYSTTETDCFRPMREAPYRRASCVADTAASAAVRRSARLYRDDRIARLWPTILVHGHQECARIASRSMNGNLSPSVVLFQLAAVTPKWLRRIIGPPLRMVLVVLGLGTHSPFQVRFSQSSGRSE